MGAFTYRADKVIDATSYIAAAPLVSLGFIVILFVWERVGPLRTPTRRLWPRLMVNGGMSILTFLVAFVLVRPAYTWSIDWSSQVGLGVVAGLSSWPIVQFVVGFLLLDLSFYWWHRANHELPWLWRFHCVHHSDPDLDVSTGFRFHPAEVALSTLFRTVQGLVIGATPALFITFEVVFQVATFFHHSNIRMSLKLEKTLNAALVTPRMHGIHHSQRKSESSSNYSVIFSIWDRLHRSFRFDGLQSDLRIGVPAYSAPDDNRFAAILLAPFKKQRSYWPANR